VSLPAADVLPVGPRATPMFRLLRAVLGPVLKLVFDFQLEHADRIPHGQPYVAISNHLNWIDAWCFLLLFPIEPRVHFLANPENLVRHRVHWWFVRQVGGYIPVDLNHKAGPELYEQVDRCLRRGGVVAMMPEAAYGPREGELQQMKRGFSRFVAENQVPLLPVALSGTKELWLRKRIRVIVGEPIEPAGRDADAMYDLGVRALSELLPTYTDPGGRKPLKKLLTNLLY
jgi:1-acyl-sn-glycerol-3-phosphate acyltransferase